MVDGPEKSTSPRNPNYTTASADPFAGLSPPNQPASPLTYPQPGRAGSNPQQATSPMVWGNGTTHPTYPMQYNTQYGPQDPASTFRHRTVRIESVMLDSPAGDMSMEDIFSSTPSMHGAIHPISPVGYQGHAGNGAQASSPPSQYQNILGSPQM
jgi:hypothetical protein